MFWTRGSVSLQRMIDLPGPRAFWMIPLTSTENGSGFVPWKTVHTSPRWPALTSDRGKISPCAAWAPRRQVADARRESVRSVRPIERSPNLCVPLGFGEFSKAANDRIHRLARPVDRGALVGRADEGGLEGARRQVDSRIEATVEKSREESRVGLQRTRVVAHGLGREEDTEHRSRLGHLRFQPLRPARAGKRVAHLSPERVQPRVRGVFLQELQGRDPRGHRSEEHTSEL